VQTTGLTNVDGLTGVCVCVTGLISVGLAASYVGFPLQFVCGCFGGNCGLFLGSVTLYWLRSLGKFEEFEVEVIWDVGRVRLTREAISLKKNFYRLSFTPPPLLSPNPVLQVVSVTPVFPKKTKCITIRISGSIFIHK
jgi:hypothetical protein